MKRIVGKTRPLLWVTIGLLFWNESVPLVSAETPGASGGDRAPAAAPTLAGSRFDDLLGQLQALLQRGAAETAPGRGFAEIGPLERLKGSLIEEDQKNQAYFLRMDRFLRQEGLAAEILERQAAFVRDYDAQYDALMGHFGAIEAAHRTATGWWGRVTGRSRSVDWAGVIGGAVAFLDANTPKPSRAHFDPRNLPHRSLRADHSIPPKLTRDEWLGSYPEATNQSGSSLQGAAPPAQDDIAETIEVQFTPEIKQLADSLGKNPVKIYDWVRNNIEFVPTWGSIQGAQLCMETKQCNAFDTASLLIALLRYSGVPARYQMGTIEVPIDKFENWAGGFTSAEAAASLFASGGIPSVVRRVDAAGKVVSVKLEHIWVKAFVSYAPSGGAVNHVGDTWVDLDASYKQFTYAPRKDFGSSLPSDRTALVNQLLSGSRIDTAGGSATSANTTALGAVVDSAAAQIQRSEAGLPGQQVLADLFGSKTIQMLALSILPARLPFTLIVPGQTFADIPPLLRHDLRIELQDRSGGVLLRIDRALPEVAGRRLALDYVAATAADATALAGLGRSKTGAETLPGSIRVKPELRVDETVVASGDPVPLGTPQVLKYRFAAPTITTADVTADVTAGEQIAIGLDLAQIGRVQIADNEGFFHNLSDLIDANRRDEISRYNVTDRLLNSIIATWFSRVDAMDTTSAGAADAVTLRYPSLGLCFLHLAPSALFGASAGASIEGLSLDIGRDVVITMSREERPTDARNLSVFQGWVGSTLEAELPNTFFGNLPGTPSWGSTTTLIAAANEAGIPIIGINDGNSAALIPTLNLPQDAIQEISDAVHAGLSVLTPRDEITQLGFRGVGYVIQDPVSGSATYRVSGGRLNGGVLLGSASGVSDQTPAFVDTMLSLLQSAAASLAAPVLSLIDNVVTLIQDFWGVLQCLAKQGPSVGELLVDLAALLVVALAAYLAFVYIANPVTAAILATLFGAGAAAPVAGVVVDVLVGLALGKAALKAAKAITGC